LAEEVSKILRRVSKPLTIRPELKPHVILVAGVNGSGKTTTIGKLAQKYRGEGLKVMLAAGDTFRAAAVEQLKIWGERTGAPVIAKDIGADAPGLAYEAFEKARAEAFDVLLIDTAGRLQNKAGLMAELEKMVRVIKKLDPNAPHSAILVLDATTGQNAVAQAEVFRETARITGVVMTKLDGTARGGILVSIAEKFDLPVHYVGVGEGADDLQPFDAETFAKALVGVAA
jgi:fused signal recognition particle receptor